MNNNGPTKVRDGVTFQADEGTFITGGSNDNQMVILIEAKK